MPEGKRILYVGGFQLPDINAAAHRVLGIGKSLRDAGYIVEYLDVSDRYTDSTLSSAWECQGFTVYSQRHSSTMLQRIRYSTYPLHPIEVLNKHQDWFAVIAYNFPAVALYVLRKECRKRKIKIISDSTEWYAFEPKTLTGFLNYLDSELRMRVVQKRLNGIITISQYLENYYKNYLPTILIPPTIDYCDPKWHLVKEKESVKDGIIRLIYAGSPSKTKESLSDTISAVSKLGPAVQFQIIGLDINQYIKLYDKEIDEFDRLEHKENIEFIGRVSHEEALKRLEMADFTLIIRPQNKTNRAGFPTKFVEAVTAGTKIIATDISDLKKYALTSVYIVNKISREEIGRIIEQASVSRDDASDREIFDYRKYTGSIKSFLRMLRDS